MRSEAVLEHLFDYSRQLIQQRPLITFIGAGILTHSVESELKVKKCLPEKIARDELFYASMDSEMASYFQRKLEQGNKR